MVASLDVVELLRGAVVVLFVAVSLLLLGAGLVRRSRVRDIKMSWGTGRLFGLPLGPTLFLLGVVGATTYGVLHGSQQLFGGWVVGGAYIFGGLCWYIGAMLLGSTMVTELGISCCSRRRHRILPWRKITDYVVTLQLRGSRYVFFLVDESGRKHRVEVMVPAGITARFQSFVETKLDSRYNKSMQRPHGKRALEQ